MEEGGADIIELGMPFSDPIADGPAIQETNTVRLYAPESPLSSNCMFCAACSKERNKLRRLPFVCQGGAQKGTQSTRSSYGFVVLHTFPRAHLLTSLSGYYNPLLAYGEDKAIQNAREAGANGYIMVDLPPEEAVGFMEKVKKEGCAETYISLKVYIHQHCSLSYVPLIAPSTSLPRIKFLSSIADSFIYVVSKVCTTSIATRLKLPYSRVILDGNDRIISKGRIEL